jgi:hypothetical protein
MLTEVPDHLFKATPSTPLSEVMYNIFPLVSIDPRALRLGYSEAFNFGVQQELTPTTRLEISYVGNRGHRLTDTALAFNQGSTSEFLRLVQNYGINNRFDHWVCDAASAAAIRDLRIWHTLLRVTPGRDRAVSTGGRLGRKLLAVLQHQLRWLAFGPELLRFDGREPC